MNLKNITDKVRYSEIKPYTSFVRSPSPKRMVMSSNLTIVNKAVREVPMGQTDYQNTLPVHNSQHNRLYDMTTYQNYHSRSNKERMEHVLNKKENKRPAGFEGRAEKHRGLKCNSVLTGENYQDESDPKYNMHVQRTWLNKKDKCLEVAKSNIERNHEYARE